jgi:mannose-6-phosphate isomerase-like protein (cupin superfamily)
MRMPRQPHPLRGVNQSRRSDQSVGSGSQPASELRSHSILTRDSRQEPVRPTEAPQIRLRFSAPSSWRRYWVPPGGGTPPHIHHREEETFYLQQGTLTIEVGGKTLNASPGDFVHLPRGIAHCFRNTGNVNANFLMVVTPAGLEKFFAEAFYPAGDGSAELPPMTAAFLARVLEAPQAWRGVSSARIASPGSGRAWLFGPGVTRSR